MGLKKRMDEMTFINKHHLCEFLEEKVARSLWQFLGTNMNTCEWETVDYTIGAGENIQKRYHALKHYRLSNVIKLCDKNKINIGHKKSVWKNNWEEISEMFEILGER